MKHIKRHLIREDLLYFVAPALLTFFAGLLVSFTYGSDSLVFKIIDLIEHPQLPPQITIKNIVGLILIIAGYTILIIGQVTIGRFHSSTVVIKVDHQLVTHGIYRHIRHPMYLGAILVSLGFPVFSSSLLGLFIMIVLIPVFLMRIRLEERLLSEEFGDAFLVYKSTTRKLVPYIY